MIDVVLDVSGIYGMRGDGSDDGRSKGRRLSGGNSSFISGTDESGT